MDTLGREDITETYRHLHSRAFNTSTERDMKNTLGLAPKMMALYKKKARFLVSKQISKTNLVYYLAQISMPKHRMKSLNEQGGFPSRLIAAIHPSNMSEDFEHIGRSFSMRVIENVVCQDPGRGLKSANGTWWGAFNIVTRAHDHVLHQGNEKRLLRATGPVARRRCGLSISRCSTPRRRDKPDGAFRSQPSFSKQGMTAVTTFYPRDSLINLIRSTTPGLTDQQVEAVTDDFQRTERQGGNASVWHSTSVVC